MHQPNDLVRGKRKKRERKAAAFILLRTIPSLAQRYLPEIARIQAINIASSTVKPLNALSYKHKTLMSALYYPRQSHLQKKTCFSNRFLPHKDKYMVG